MRYRVAAYPAIWILALLMALQAVSLQANDPSSSGTRDFAVASKPNIIFILADDLGYGEVGVYGQNFIRTPCLDQMAAEGIRFTSHFAGGAVCGPSRATLMTGQSQAIGYIKGNPGGNPMRENLRDEDVTVAELLKSAGYETACIGKWGLGPQGKSGYPLKQGFDYFLGYDTHNAAHQYYPKTLCENDGERNLSNRQYSHDVFTEQALTFLDQKRKSPYFLYLAYTIPHAPYNPPDIEPYDGEDWHGECKKYAAMITRMDRDIGRIVEKVKQSKKDALIIFTSDNGPQSGGTTEGKLTRLFDSNGEQKGIKRDVYNGGIRVPFIAWWPGKIEANSVSGHISGFQDFLPTACELAGTTPQEATDGLSYLPTLMGKRDQQVRHEWLYWEFLFMPNMKKKPDAKPTGRQAILNPGLGFKAVRFGRHSPVELYRFEEDTSEINDMAGRYPDIAEQMTKYLNACRSESELWPIRFHDIPLVSTFSPHYETGEEKRNSTKK